MNRAELEDEVRTWLHQLAELLHDLGVKDIYLIKKGTTAMIMTEETSREVGIDLEDKKGMIRAILRKL